MDTWWNSVETVSRINTWMQVFIVVFGILTAAATAFKIIASNRISALQSVEAAALRQRLEITEKNANAAHQHLIQRSLSEAQEQDLIQILRAIEVKARIPVICSETRETMVFGSQIMRILQEAGWDTNPSLGTASPAWEGLILTVENPSQPPVIATALVSELAKYGFSVTIANRAGAPKVINISASMNTGAVNAKLDLLNFWIGEKPEIK